MRVAVLFTGQERSLRRTIRLLRKNLLEPNNATVFFACETGNNDAFKQHFDGIEIGGADLRDSFRCAEFGGLVHMIYTSSRVGLTQNVFDRTSEGWSINYVFNSGTLLQYYQVWKAWMLVLKYEAQHKMKFDVVVRCRPDSLITEKLDLSSVMSSDELVCRSLGCERIRQTIEPTGQSTENAVVMLGIEQFWVARRHIFALFGPMVFMYGVWDSGSPYAFNSEAFFAEFCKAHQISYWIYCQGNLFNTNHPGTDEVLDDPLVFSLLR